MSKNRQQVPIGAGHHSQCGERAITTYGREETAGGKREGIQTRLTRLPLSEADAADLVAFLLKVARKQRAAREKEIADGTPKASAARRNDPAKRDARPRANREVSQEAAGAGGKSPRQRGARKGAE
jgi:hypothetical protein